MRAYKNFRHVLSLPVASLVKLLRLKIFGKEYLLSGTCLRCGRCCRLINLKYHKGWIRAEHQFHEVLKENPNYERFTVTAKDHMGYLQFNCSWYDPENGCLDYANRLDICRRYPNTSLLLHGGSLLQGCGYRIDEGVPFEKYLCKELKKKREE